jgi:hypothetical protein
MLQHLVEDAGFKASFRLLELTRVCESVHEFMERDEGNHGVVLNLHGLIQKKEIDDHKKKR